MLLNRPFKYLNGTKSHIDVHSTEHEVSTRQSYLKGMKEVKPIEDLAYLKTMNDIAEDLPPERRQMILAYSLKRTTYKYKGSSRRFGFFNDRALEPLCA